MTKQKKPKSYRVGVYFQDDEGVWHHHGTWTGEAANPADAKTKAVEAVSDVRIDRWKAEIISRVK